MELSLTGTGAGTALEGVTVVVELELAVEMGGWRGGASVVDGVGGAASDAADTGVLADAEVAAPSDLIAPTSEDTWPVEPSALIAPTVSSGADSTGFATAGTGVVVAGTATLAI